MTKWTQLVLIAAAELLVMGLWFSASAVLPQLTAEWSLDAARGAWMTMSVQLGFVAGAVLSALLNLPDRFDAARLVAACSAAGAACNALIPILDAGAGATILLRFLTGVTLAGVYPPGMKLVASWCREDRGLGIGFLVGALSVGSAGPHLLNAIPFLGAGGMPPWRPVLLAASGLAAVGALIAALGVRPGPFLAAPAPFDWRYAARAFTHRPTCLANFGYLGHMWELYAMWAWTPVLLMASYEQAGWSLQWARLAGFSVIAAGFVGCVAAGLLADRIGRTATAGGSLVASGSCALVAGFLFPSPGILTAICLLWGVAVVADSAQFSAAVSELADPRYVGTALTVQTSAGFLLTILTIRIVPPIVEAAGWRIALPVLAVGPAFGIWSMIALRRHPEAVRMASGKR